ncbi:hypothetical protein B0T26DRAFT_428324 [Lasiosphaeria miniovina]|uniref:Uncharacterized protein n=1 Tax=Lasiosphaeria miniovina TaxID=1954250 RepID=A0AA40A636_9PEZI|nr:uncharacterized protein B0T26DRAFT_428324 [Lasiosphaeria miniovina]KAK0709900.1 hypothetical protein B0T26DRAFT_428324 [Lasiosphaeria miniovina]
MPSFLAGPTSHKALLSGSLALARLSFLWLGQVLPLISQHPQSRPRGAWSWRPPSRQHGSHSTGWREKREGGRRVPWPLDQDVSPLSSSPELSSSCFRASTRPTASAMLEVQCLRVACSLK